MKKKDLIPILLILAAFLAYPTIDRKLVSKFFPPKERPAPVQSVEAPEMPANPELAAPEEAAAEAESPAGAEPAAVAGPEAAAPEDEAVPETTETLENADLRVTFSSRGAGIVRAEILKYPEAKDSDRCVAFDFAERPAAAPSADGLPAGASFVVVRTGERSLTFTRDLPNGFRMAREVALDDAGGRLRIADRFENASGHDLSLSGYRLQSGWMGNLPGETQDRLPLLGVDTLSGSDVEFWGGKFEKWFKSLAPGVQRQTVPGPDRPAQSVEWAAAKNKYFVQILTPATFAESCTVSARRGPSERVSSMIFFSRTVTPIESIAAEIALPAQPVPAGETLTQESTFYVGPKDYASLKANGPHQEEILQLGFWRPIGILILKIMVWFHDHIWPYSYGLAIILLTFLIRIVFWPLNHKSMMSTQRMQEIQPEITALRERYKSDPARQQQEMMKLYREKKINPMGGCLPMLIQIPVFFALFIVLRGAIELRFSSFLWISDLSTPENLFADKLPFALNILPLLMGFTMWLQQRMTPTSDPQQQKMMLMMPIIFTLMFYSFPSGLSLYWTTNQVMMIIQLAIMRHRHPPQIQPAPAA